MKYSLFIAFRYLVAKKTHHAVHYISRITALGFMVGSFALIVILSTLNGFEGLILTMYANFDPDLKVEPTTGKTLHFTTQDFEIIEQTPGLLSYHKIIEEQAVVKHFDNQTACYIKGVDKDYFNETALSPYIAEGSGLLYENGQPQAILGAGVDFKLQTRVGNPLSTITLYTPRRGNYSITDPNLIQSKTITPSGVIYLDDQINQKYVFIPYETAATLFERDSAFSYLEIRIKPGFEKAAESHIEAHFGNTFLVKNRIQQQEALYKMFASEKWVTFALLSFVMLLASFNVTGSLTMLVVEKKKDIFTLATLGASKSFIRQVFLYQGMLVAFIGGFVGLGVGSLLVWAQSKFNIITMSGAIVEAYPVKLLTSDIALIFCTTLILGFITSILPAWNAYNQK